MKQCVPRKSARILSVAVILCAAGVSFFAFRELFRGKQSAVPCLLMGLLFGGCALFLLRSMISLGNWGYFYDEEKIIFVLSRKDRREFRWQQLQQAGVGYPAQTGYFCFPDGKRIALNPQMEGYQQLVAMMQQKGLRAVQATNFEIDAKEIFQQFFGEQFTKGKKK